MAIEAGFDLSELDALNNQLLNLAQYPFPPGRGQRRTE